MQLRAWVLAVTLGCGGSQAVRSSGDGSPGPETKKEAAGPSSDVKVASSDATAGERLERDDSRGELAADAAPDAHVVREAPHLSTAAELPPAPPPDRP
jgi:hypothetical protein